MDVWVFKCKVLVLQFRYLTRLRIIPKKCYDAS
jgi:hypothetical protein